MSDKVNTLCLSFLCGPMTIGLIWWLVSVAADRAQSGTGTYPPQRTVQDVSRSYDPFGAMATQRTDYGEINETARVAHDHVNGHGAGVTGNINVFENDLKDPTTAAHIDSLQRTQGKGENTYKLVFRKGNRP